VLGQFGIVLNFGGGMSSHPGIKTLFDRRRAPIVSLAAEGCRAADSSCQTRLLRLMRCCGFGDK
jgi:hypothetical protein